MKIDYFKEYLKSVNVTLSKVSYRYKHYRYISKVFKNKRFDNRMFSRELLKEYINKWKPINSYPSTFYFKRYSSYLGKVDLNFVPDYLYGFRIFRTLSDLSCANYIEHKGLYLFRRPDLKEFLPQQFLSKIAGIHYDTDYREIDDVGMYLKRLEEIELVYKIASDSKGGQGIFFFTKSEKDGMYYDKIGNNLLNVLALHKDVVLQEKIKQSEYMSKFNPSSINSFRVITYRSVADNRVHVLHCLARFGRRGSSVDNVTSGGYWVLVDKGGKLADYSVDFWLNKTPFNTIRDIPYMSQINHLAIKIAEKEFFNRELFLDFYVDGKDQVKLIEINLSGNPKLQGLHGPMFGEFTDEVIDYCRKHNGKYVFSANIGNAK